MTCARANYVHINVRARVFRVIKVKHRLPVYDPNRNRRDVICDGERRGELAIVIELAKRKHHCYEGPCDGCRARPAIGLNHVAVEVNSSLSEAVPLNHCAQRAPYQALNLLRAARQRVAASLAL